MSSGGFGRTSSSATSLPSSAATLASDKPMPRPAPVNPLSILHRLDAQVTSRLTCKHCDLVFQSEQVQQRACLVVECILCNHVGYRRRHSLGSDVVNKVDSFISGLDQSSQQMAEYYMVCSLQASLGVSTLFVRDTVNALDRAVPSNFSLGRSYLCTFFSPTDLGDTTLRPLPGSPLQLLPPQQAGHAMQCNAHASPNLVIDQRDR